MSDTYSVIYSPEARNDIKDIYSYIAFELLVYQIFTYVKNKEYEMRDKDHKVAGMLLYAKTDEEIYPNNVYQMSGNQISVRTLDLNLPFSEIAEQLNTIAKTHFDL